MKELRAERERSRRQKKDRGGKEAPRIKLFRFTALLLASMLMSLCGAAGRTEVRAAGISCVATGSAIESEAVFGPGAQGGQEAGRGPAGGGSKDPLSGRPVDPHSGPGEPLGGGPKADELLSVASGSALLLRGPLPDAVTVDEFPLTGGPGIGGTVLAALLLAHFALSRRDS